MATRLNKRSTQPLYAQLKEMILDRINEGIYKPDEKIPSELELCRELDLSRPTVRQAVAELVNEGILLIVKGKGTYVASEPQRIEIRGFTPFTFSFLSARSLEGFKDLSIISREGDRETDRHFGLPGGAGHPGYWQINWQIGDDSQILAICENLVPIQMFPDLGRDIKESRRMIDITANKYAFLPQKAVSRMIVRPSSGDEARILDTIRSAPVISISTTLKSRSGNCCEYAASILRADLMSLVFDGIRS